MTNGVWIRREGRTIQVGRIDVLERAKRRPERSKNALQEFISFEPCGFVMFIWKEWSQATTLELP